MAVYIYVYHLPCSGFKHEPAVYSSHNIHSFQIDILLLPCDVNMNAMNILLMIRMRKLISIGHLMPERYYKTCKRNMMMSKNG